MTAEKCPGSLVEPGTWITGGWGRHNCSTCKAQRFPRRDGLFPNHKYQTKPSRP